MKLDLKQLAFSRYGSYLAISERDNSLVLRDIGGEDFGALLRIHNNAPLLWDAEETELRAVPSKITDSTQTEQTAQSRQIRLCFPVEDVLLIHSEGLAFRLDFVCGKYEHLNQLGPSEWEYHSYAQDVKLRLTLFSGKQEQNSPMQLDFTEHSTLAIERYICVPRSVKIPQNYEEGLAQVRTAYRAYTDGIPPCMPRYQKSRELAAYTTWSSVVGPSGLLKRPAMYMSNNWMTNLWSWDNCFNAIALAPHRPQLAFDQFIAFADFQDESGVLPDYANKRFVSFACCKPPIYGWAYSRLLEQNPFFAELAQLRPTYNMLKGIERYWTQHRTRSGWPLPYYNHGNDSGWDNATVFAEGCPVTSPDLPAYLILLYEALEEIAHRLAHQSEQKDEYKNAAQEWHQKAESMTHNMVKMLWDGTRFCSWDVLRQKPVAAKYCLMDWMPIVVAHRLDQNIRDSLVKHLTQGSHRTRYGLATEALDSPDYQSAGYWRGPIWAPVTLLIADGLRRSGETQAAISVARDFCEATLIGGMAENFDAQIGAGLEDPAYTWTSSVFLHFANNYLEENKYPLL